MLQSWNPESINSLNYNLCLLVYYRSHTSYILKEQYLLHWSSLFRRDLKIPLANMKKRDNLAHWIDDIGVEKEAVDHQLPSPNSAQHVPNASRWWGFTLEWSLPTLACWRLMPSSLWCKDWHVWLGRTRQTVNISLASPITYGESDHDIPLITEPKYLMLSRREPGNRPPCPSTSSWLRGRDKARWPCGPATKPVDFPPLLSYLPSAWLSISIGPRSWWRFGNPEGLK